MPNNNQSEEVERMLRQDAKRRMALWREENETYISTKDYVFMWFGVIWLIIFISWVIIR